MTDIIEVDICPDTLSLSRVSGLVRFEFETIVKARHAFGPVSLLPVVVCGVADIGTMRDDAARYGRVTLVGSDEFRDTHVFTVRATDDLTAALDEIEVK